ncbi:GIY-YIG nuclease family protein [Vibrio tubiashii]|uniref:GIY-YIG nuclease family protein n=1 Tax=Vibrio tubiashii TaxID=29498 RepID=A0AAE5GQQ8_9VIBR|nr:GIY-YIG nuclease family protein [Vibrio tubiashii]NOI81311.1 GIY-YIG nuclease family protein [Vibrio tubiashii]
MKFKWDEIYLGNDDIPSASGIYAWYYVPQLSDVDIQNMYSELAMNKHSIQARKSIIYQFLNRRLFSFYGEDPYSIKISGPLKPTYRGSIFHDESVSDSLVTKIESGEVSISQLKALLSNVTEPFLSPIYIGMATNLNKRINQHKHKIIKIRDGVPQDDGKEEFELRDNNFASRVCERKYITSFMFVVCMSVDSEDKIQNPFENVLNRINYPILGRN